MVPPVKSAKSSSRLVTHANPPPTPSQRRTDLALDRRIAAAKASGAFKCLSKFDQVGDGWGHSGGTGGGGCLVVPRRPPEVQGEGQGQGGGGVRTVLSDGCDRLRPARARGRAVVVLSDSRDSLRNAPPPSHPSS